MIPAGEMRVFGNKSLGYARAIVNVGLSYEQHVAEALKALEDVATEWGRDRGRQGDHGRGRAAGAGRADLTSASRRWTPA